MQLAGKHLEMLGYTSALIVAPLLLPEMVERLAAMLNYFLLQLTGPQRKVLKVKDPEKYGFKPRELLGQVRVDVNLIRRGLGLRLVNKSLGLAQSKSLSQH